MHNKDSVGEETPAGLNQFSIKKTNYSYQFFSSFHTGKANTMIVSLESCSIFVEITCQKALSIFSSSCSSMNGAKLEIYRFIGSCYGCLRFKVELHWPSGMTKLSKFLQNNFYICLLSY
jgi:hypothetical protein